MIVPPTGRDRWSRHPLIGFLTVDPIIDGPYRRPTAWRLLLWQCSWPRHLRLCM